MYIDCDYDARMWLGIPSFDEFDAWQDPRVWANEVGQDFWLASGIKPRQGEIGNFSERLLILAEGRMQDKTPDSAHYIYLPHPRATPQTVITWIAHHPDCRLTDWVVAADAEAVAPPTVEEFQTPFLGAGLRAFRSRRANPGAGGAYSVLRYAFPIDGEETAVVVTTAVPDADYLRKSMPDLDDFVRKLHLVHEGSMYVPDTIA